MPVKQLLYPNDLSYTGSSSARSNGTYSSYRQPTRSCPTSSRSSHATAGAASRGSCFYLHALTRMNPFPFLRDVVSEVGPLMHFVRQVCVACYALSSVMIKDKQRVRDALKWTLASNETRGGRTVKERLAREIVLVLYGTSSALKQKASLHEQTTTNRGNIPPPRTNERE